MSEQFRTENYFTGTITEVVDKVLYVIKADIPGIIQGITAFPMRGEVDEPRVGDFVLLKNLDPMYSSYFLYQKIKENDYIGFRSNGKMVDITPDYITIGIFDPNTEFNDLKDSNNYRPEPSDWIKIDKDGNMNIHLRSNSDLVIKGGTSIEINGNADIKVKGSTTIQSPKIEIKGPGTLKCSGVVVPSETGGPFIAVPTAPPPGTPMISGDTIILN